MSCKLLKLAELKFVSKDMAQSTYLHDMGQMVFEKGLSFLFMKAILQDYDILDCVAIINLEEVPPLIDLELQSDFLLTIASSTGLETARSDQRSK